MSLVRLMLTRFAEVLQFLKPASLSDSSTYELSFSIMFPSEMKGGLEGGAAFLTSQLFDASFLLQPWRAGEGEGI